MYKIANKDLRKIVINSPVSIYLLGEHGYFKLVNRQFLQLSGYSKGEIKRVHFSQLIHPEDRVKVQTRVQERFHTPQGVPQEYSFRAVTKDGHTLYVTGYFCLLNIEGEQMILGQLLDETEKRLMQEELRMNEEAYRSIIDHSGVGYFEVDLAGNLVKFNSTVSEKLGYSPEELEGMNNRDLSDSRNAKRVYEAFHQVYLTGQPHSFFDWELITKDGRRLVVETAVALVRDKDGNKVGFRSIVQDVTKRKQAEQALKISEEKYRAIFEGSGAASIIIDVDTTIVMANREFSKLAGYSRQELEGKKKWTEFVSEKDLQRMVNYHYQRRASEGAAPVQYEFEFVRRNGERRFVLVTVSVMPNSKLSIASILDFTERRRMEEELKTLSLHDSMTGLFNRHYFEEELKRHNDGRHHPVGIVVCDVDGLKQVNDNYGHKAGDEVIKTAAKVLKAAFRESDMVARIGGDEFAVLLPKSEQSTVQQVVERLRGCVAAHNAGQPRFLLSISIGYAVSDPQSTSDLDLVLREADNNMYKDKLRSNKSSRSDTVQVLRKILEAKGLISEEQDLRMQRMAILLARKVGLKESDILDLQLLAQFHDVGKVCVSETILFKPAKLDNGEFEEIKKHCRVGHLIARSAIDLVPISDYILTHHEWWNGEGYPLGLKNHEIPLICRIMAIVEAYWAMTSERPYRPALTHAQALEELQRCAGTQFDPGLVELFVQEVEQNAVC